MPLHYRDMTPAEQITLLLYPTVFTAVGGTLVLQAPSRTSSPAFETAKLLAGWLPLLAPIQWWGAAFLVVASIEVAALASHAPARVYIRALEAGAGLIGFWLVMLLWSALQSPLVSLTGWEWLLLALGAQVASARQLAAREVR